MNKIITLLVVGISIFVATQLMSCKKDKEDKEASLVGTWASQTFSYKATINGVVEQDNTEVLTGYEITFNSDNTLNFVDIADPTNNNSGTYFTSGSKIYTVSSEGSIDTADYTITSIQLTSTHSETYTSAGATIKSESKTVYLKK